MWVGDTIEEKSYVQPQNYVIQAYLNNGYIHSSLLIKSNFQYSKALMESV